MYALAMITLAIGVIFIVVAGISASILHKQNKQSKV
jgi:uncharacterized membrane protein